MVTESSFSIFIALVELRPLNGCELNEPDIAGAAVRCYVAEKGRAEAIRRLEQSFTERRFELIEMEWCVNEAEVIWEHPDDATAQDMIANARKTGDVVYGEFHVWGFE